MADPGTLERIRAFSHALEDASATRRISSPLGTGLINDDYPLSHAHNFLRIEGARPELTPERVEAEANDLLGGAGRAHRQVAVEDEATARRLEPAMRQRSWTMNRLIYMAWMRPPDRSSDAMAEVVDWSTVRPVVEVAVRREPYATGEEVVRQLVDRRAATARATRLRHLAAPSGGPYGSFAELYSDGRTAQVESVNTLEEYRNRGLARAVVLGGAELARAEGHDLVFLVADEDDWPKDLYRRLGFDVIGHFAEFERD